MQSISVFLDIKELQIFGEKMLMSPELKGCVTDSYTFWIFFRSGISVTSFISVILCLTDFRTGNLFGPSPSWSSAKNAHLNRVNTRIVKSRGILGKFSLRQSKI